MSSTGVIGQILDIEPFEEGIPAAADALSRAGGSDAALAIMTTDTHPKEYAVTYESQAAGYLGSTFTVGGCCKGSGMIMPNMATMIALITTDAPVRPETLHGLLRSAVDQTFNRVTVDSDTSTNDTCIMFASAQNEHVLRCPFYGLRASVHQITVVTARLPVLQGQPKCVDNVKNGSGSENDSSCQSIPVGSQKLANGIVAGRAD